MALKRILRLLGLFIALLLLLQVFGGTAVFAREETDPEDFIRRIGKETILAALYEADIPSLRKAIDLRLVSCVELTQYYLDRIEAYNDDYNCFITMCDNALEKAKACDRQLIEGTATGRLFGIPIVVKDNIHYEGYPTTNGYSKRYASVSTGNAQIVEYILAEGGIVLAKSNMSAGALASRESRSAVCETKNAYNPHLSSGGSSGGSAVATSLNFTAAALGTDTNASLRYPAALAGCVSLRVTSGMLSRDGIIRLNPARDVPGAITRSVYDQALMLDILSGGKTGYTDALDASVLSGLRLGILQELTYPTRHHYLRTEANMDAEVITAFENAVRELEALGAQVIPVSIPDLFSLSKATSTQKTAASRQTLYKQLKKKMEEANVSALIFPTYSSTPLRSGKDSSEKNWDPYKQTYLLNCAQVSPSSGMPEISVPIGVHSLGAGIGMEIAALNNEEQLLLNIAYGYTSQYDHRVIPEGAPNLHEKTMSLADIFAAYESYLICLEQLPALAQIDCSVEDMQTLCRLVPWCEENLERELALSLPIGKLFRPLGPQTDPDPPQTPVWIWWAGFGCGVGLLILVTAYRLHKRRQVAASASEATP